MTWRPVGLVTVVSGRGRVVGYYCLPAASNTFAGRRGLFRPADCRGAVSSAPIKCLERLSRQAVCPGAFWRGARFYWRR